MNEPKPNEPTGTAVRSSELLDAIMLSIDERRHKYQDMAAITGEGTPLWHELDQKLAALAAMKLVMMDAAEKMASNAKLTDGAGTNA